MPKRVDLLGFKFGRLTVVRKGPVKNTRQTWVCICECGNEKTATNGDLKKGHVRSCGCLMIGNPKHGHAKGNGSPTYRSWRAMMNRCTNKSVRDYEQYGGRGITICERWTDSFEKFLLDMGERPDGCSLDRINSNGNYEPLNCRWATPSEQVKNRRPFVRRWHKRPVNADSVGSL